MTDCSVFLLRAVAGLLFLEHGGMKLWGWFGGMGGELGMLMMMAGILEFFGGLAILIGLFTRPIAFILAGEMAVAYFMAHASQGYFYAPLMNKGEPTALFAFIFLFFAAYGAGRYGIDALRSRKAVST